MKWCNGHLYVDSYINMSVAMFCPLHSLRALQARQATVMLSLYQGQIPETVKLLSPLKGEDLRKAASAAGMDALALLRKTQGWVAGFPTVATAFHPP
jgi:hypothetical protein